MPSSPLGRKAKTPNSATNMNFNGTPSLLNGSGDGKSVATGGSIRFSDGLMSISSLTQSRSSSAQGSYSTSATTYDEDGTAAPKPTTDVATKRQSETKGNILVSVRVRPDAGQDRRPDGEWLVDGRKSLIAYNGKEGGEYLYGKYAVMRCLS